MATSKTQSRAFTGNVLRDGISVVRQNKITDDTMSAVGLVTVATFEALKITATPYLINPATGFMPMGAASGIFLMFGGTAATNTGLYIVKGYWPVYSYADNGRATILGYHVGMLALGGFTISSALPLSVVGADGVIAAMLPQPAGATAFAGATDKFADVVSVTGGDVAASTALTAAWQGNHFMSPTSTQGPAVLRINCQGAMAVQIGTSRNASATSIFCLGGYYQSIDSQRTSS